MGGIPSLAIACEWVSFDRSESNCVYTTSRPPQRRRTCVGYCFNLLFVHVLVGLRISYVFATAVDTALCVVARFWFGSRICVLVPFVFPATMAGTSRGPTNACGAHAL